MEKPRNQTNTEHKNKEVTLHLSYVKYLEKGNETNQLVLLVDNIDLKPFSRVRGGRVEDGISVKINKYNLENLLCQMIEDYGQDELIKRIKVL